MRRSTSGFTLIEILLALAVLAIGMVGILALFPVGLDNSKRAINDTTSANIAESVKSAIVQAMRLKPSGTAEVEFIHDGASSGLKFNLPPTDPIDSSNFERKVPKDATAGASAGKDVFWLGQAASAGYPANVEAGDPSRDQQLSQWSFNFLIRPTTNPAVKNTYEVLIQVFRNFDESAPAGERPVNTFTTIVNTAPTTP